MKKALIVYGGYEGHFPTESSALFARVLEQEGFEVVLSDTLDTFANAEDNHVYDLIIPNWTMGSLTKEQEEGLTATISKGSGLGGWHGGMGDAFRGNPKYQFMAGGQFVAHPSGIRSYTVRITDHNHVITEGIGDFEMNSEQYFLHVDPSNKVLATVTFEGTEFPWIEGSVIPAVWTRRWGEGRVFYCSLGHKLDDFEVPECREIIRRGLLWAARE